MFSLSKKHTHGAKRLLIGHQLGQILSSLSLSTIWALYCLFLILFSKFVAQLRQQAKCTGRQDNPICAEVLNDQWVSVPTGSEDGTGFKSSRKNQYEELLFKCEDDRFELDLVIENNLSTIRQLEALAEQFKGVKATGTADTELKLRDEDLDALAVRSIKRVYGDRGEDVLKLLFARPAHAIPVVLNRLKQKHIEWSQTRRDWNKLWRQISKKHYSKALDYQSVNFKAEEKKNLSAKNLLAELKRKAGPAMPLAVTAANLFESESLGGPHAELQYSISDFAANHQYLVQTVLPAAIGADSQSTPNALTPTEQSNAAAVGYVMGLTDVDVELGSKAFSTGFSSLWGDARRLVLCLFENVHPKIDKPKFENLFDDFLGVLFKYVPSAGSGASAAGVKPVATQVDTANATAPSKSVALGSEQFFLVCKYLQVLLQRLAQGRELAARPPPLRTKPQPETEAQAQFDAIKKAKEAAASGSIEPKKDPDAMDTTPADGASSSSAAPAASDAMDVDTPAQSTEMASAMPKSAPLTVDAIRARYDGFLTSIQNLISNAIDQSALEEEVRDSLGVDSFPLFTTERVVQLVGKNLVQILSDEALMQVVNIFTYELSRGAAAFADGAYINNVRQVLGQDRKAYRLLFHSDKNLLHVHEVALFPGQGGAGQAGSSPDGTNSNGNASGNAAGGSGGNQQGGSSSSDDSSTGGSANGPSGVNGSQPMQTDAAETLQMFVDGDADHSSAHSPFLKRNVSSVQPHIQERSIFMQNDLAVFVDPIASRLRYLRDSEDVLVRRGRTAAPVPNRSSSRLAAKFPSELSQQAVFAGAQ
jgi:paired amphipathic helix protein Sin3a